MLLSSPSERVPPAEVSHEDQPATALETTLMVLGGAWLVTGLYIDGYAHTEIIDTESEDFLTPWHALFYSGFFFTVLVLAVMAKRRANPKITWSSLPEGYGFIKLGLVLFTIGGVGDGVWHTIFGVESGLDALLSPTHLFLFAGMFLIVATPARSHWLTAVQRNGWGQLGAVVASSTIATALVVFFSVHVFGLFNFLFHRFSYDTAVVVDGEVVNEHLVQLGLARAYLATAILLAPTLMIVRRWSPPIGSVAVLWTVPVLLSAPAFDGDLLAVPATTAGGLVFESLFRSVDARASRRTAILVASGGGTSALWSIWLATIQFTDEKVGWPVELWSGQIVMSGLFALAVAFLATPGDVPGGLVSRQAREHRVPKQPSQVG